MLRAQDLGGHLGGHGRPLNTEDDGARSGRPNGEDNRGGQPGRRRFGWLRIGSEEQL